MVVAVGLSFVRLVVQSLPPMHLVTVFSRAYHKVDVYAYA